MFGKDYLAGITNINPIAHVLGFPGLSNREIAKILKRALKKLLKLNFDSQIDLVFVS